MNAYTNRTGRSSASNNHGSARRVAPSVSTQPSGGTQPPNQDHVVRSPRITILMACLLLLISIFFTVSLQQSSYLRVCNDLSQGSAPVCMGKNALLKLKSQFSDKTELEDGIPVSLMKHLEHKRNELDDSRSLFSDSPDLNSVYVGLLIALAGSMFALLSVAALPRDQIQFSGSFSKMGGTAKFGGALGIMLIFAIGGYAYAWKAIPASTKFEAAQDAFKSVMRENGYLREAVRDRTEKFNLALERYRDDIQKKEQAYEARLASNYKKLFQNMQKDNLNFAMRILQKGYFSKMRGSFAVRCEQNPAQPRRSLILNIPQAATRSARFGDAIGFDFSFEPLSRQLESSSDEELDMDVLLKPDENGKSLLSLTYSLQQPDETGSPNERTVMMKGIIDQAMIANHCATVEDTSPVGDPRMASGSSRGLF